eukprot:3088866-Karenia_brevis.AAC.1
MREWANKEEKKRKEESQQRKRYEEERERENTQRKIKPISENSLEMINLKVRGRMKVREMNPMRLRGGGGLKKKMIGMMFFGPLKTGQVEIS